MKPLLFVLLLLAACDRGVELTNASIGEVADAAKDIAKPQAGQWETVTELRAFDMGKVGVQDPRMAATFQAQIGKKQVVRACLSPEEAAKPVFGDIAPTAGANCRFAKFAMKDGTLDATMTCRNAGGSRLEVRQAGRYAATAVNLTATVKRTAPTGQAEGGMTTQVTSKRTGDCNGEKT